ncbi:phosphoenolpyruvate hydrolase family protein [Aeoliella sp.]|uniref:phosphoenolpyruvate hydrolase family protein n=1 Tax=Aeoliella sp. TaxID=2795800 RepID=UPI003CCB8705
MTEFQQLLAERVAQGNSPIVAVAAGSGQIVRAAVEGEADFVLALNAGVYRNHGIGSLGAFMPYGNANDQTEQLLREHHLPHVGNTPIVAGVFPVDPTMDLDVRLDRLWQLGVRGITNWPAVGFIDGSYRACLEANGLGIECEIDMLQRAQARGFATFGFAVLEEDSARCFANAGIDGLILDLGLTYNYQDLHQRRDRLQRAITFLNSTMESLQGCDSQPMCLAFGGPVTTADDLEQVVSQTRIHGFVGGSTFERLPVRNVVAGTVKQFRAVIVRHQHDSGYAGEIIGQSPSIRRLRALIKRVAAPDVNVCIEGESGVGKELVAKALHLESKRARQGMVTVNCGAIPDDLLESEFFGHEKGAFTGAFSKRKGKFELANCGTLFLDEVADLSPRGQVALLRAIQQQEITPLGSNHSIATDVRIVAASNRPLAKLVESGVFRADLYFRLNYITIEVPPLRDRVEDIPLLVENIIQRLKLTLDRPRLVGISKEFLEKLQKHSWPGNVRELEHVVGQAALLEEANVLAGNHFMPRGLALGSHTKSPVAQPAARDVESEVTATLLHDRRDQLTAALAAAGGNKSKAAKSLGVSRKTFYSWLRQVDR